MSEPTTKAIHVTEDELLVINNSINEILHGPDAIEDWEFQTRIGVDRRIAGELLAKIRSALQTEEE